MICVVASQLVARLVVYGLIWPIALLYAAYLVLAELKHRALGSLGLSVSPAAPEVVRCRRPSPAGWQQGSGQYCTPPPR